MNRKTKTLAGASAAGILATVFHIVHSGISLTGLLEKRQSNPFENAPVYIIEKNSLGKYDTMLYEDYRRRRKDSSLKFIKSDTITFQAR